LEPFTYEPLLAWGDYCPGGSPYTGYAPKVRGQIFDAFIASGPQVGNATVGGSEQIVQMYGNGMEFLNFSMGLAIANLYLLLEAPSAAFGNVAF
jgi:hypothetical protein